jgi:hypothetical protein
LLHLTSDLKAITDVVYFAPGTVEDIRYMKWTNTPGQPSGTLYISCNTADTKSNAGGYAILQLNGNFVDHIPDQANWCFHIWAEGYPKDYHPWDVDADGNVCFVTGQSHAYDWAAFRSLDHNGLPGVITHFRTHWLKYGGEWYDTPSAAYPGDFDSIAYSAVVLKFAGCCDLRSWTLQDYMMVQPDENGGQKQGRWPMDFLFNAPCTPGNVQTHGPGYTGYKPSGTPVYGASTVVVERLNGDVYLGMHTKSILPDGQPDFESAVIAFTADGALRWWSRLYHEINPKGELLNSTPDQYIDGLVIDYFKQQLVVNSRCHGNIIENFWEGNTIKTKPTAQGFQNQFTGSNGNIHISWLGKLDLDDGVLQHSTYVAEYAEGTGGFGAPHPDPNLDGWPNPNGGWPNVNTKRLARNELKVTNSGAVAVLGTGRRTITTANAYQKMVLPTWGGLSDWNSFIRVYESDFSVPLYSSLLVGQWDTLTQSGGGNTTLFGCWKTTSGIVAVGMQASEEDVPKGQSIPVINVPIWGTSQPAGTSVILSFYPTDNLFDPNDGPQNTSMKSFENIHERLTIFPSPAT